MTNKFIISPEGFMEFNPDHPASQQARSSKKRVITGVFNEEDLSEATAAGLAPHPNAVQAYQLMKSDSYLSQLGVPKKISKEAFLQQAYAVSAKYKMSSGMSAKLLMLKDFAMHFKIDDSGSMQGARWESVKIRLTKLFELLQFVQTGPITISFLNRWESYTIKRDGKSPTEFLSEANKTIADIFSKQPDGSTPIFHNLGGMLSRAKGKKTSHYLFTDGSPSGHGFGEDGFSPREEIEAIENLLLNRQTQVAQNNPVAFCCVSENPDDTAWMHETEERACRPGKPGYVSAVQNFVAERREVRNDQGMGFDYDEAEWLAATLIAAHDPNCMDALDQHAPFTKATLEEKEGRSLTEVEYRRYFMMHPLAMWLFAEDYQSFLTTPIANQIPSVNIYDTELANQVTRNFTNSASTTNNLAAENQAIGIAEKTVLFILRRERPANLIKAREAFWQKDCTALERQILSADLRAGRETQGDAWSVYLYSKKLTCSWEAFVREHEVQIVAGLLENGDNATQLPSAPLPANIREPEANGNSSYEAVTKPQAVPTASNATLPPPLYTQYNDPNAQLPAQGLPVLVMYQPYLAANDPTQALLQQQQQDAYSRPSQAGMYGAQQRRSKSTTEPQTRSQGKQGCPCSVM